MSNLKKWTVDVEINDTIETVTVRPSMRSGVNWVLNPAPGEVYHIDTKKNVRKHLEKLGFKIID